MEEMITDPRSSRLDPGLFPFSGSPDATTAVAGTIGDWLLTFRTASTGLPVRIPSTSWHTSRRRESWQLSHAPTAEGWRGSPLLSIETPEWMAWLVGELYQTADPTAAVIAVLDRRGTADGLNGHFLLLAWNRAADEWHIWTNRHATLHAYKASDGERLAVGTFMPAVAAATGARSLDWEGLASFFGFGYFAADRTHLEGVRILRPATHYHFDASGRMLSDNRYWDWCHTPDMSRSYDETLEEFAALFTAVVGDLTAEGRIAIPISGGLDSRSAVAALAAGGDARERFWAYSYGYSDDSVETRIARQLAAARHLPFESYTIPPYLFGRLPNVLTAVEGFQEVTQTRQAAVAKDLAAQSDAVIAAHLGDLYLDDMGVHTADPDHAHVDVLVDIALHKIHKGGCDWLLDNVCRPRMNGSDPRTYLRTMVASELTHFEAIDDPDFRIKAFKIDQWCARSTTASLRMFQAATFPRLPFYDTKLADFFLTVPTEYVRGRRLQLDYLRRYAPDLARVPWQVTGHDLYRTRGDSPLDLARRATRKGWRLMTNRPVLERNWEVQFMNAEGQAGLRRWLIRSGLAIHEFVAPGVIEELLSAFERNPHANKRGYTVSMLLTFSGWLELLYGRGASS